MPPPSPKPTSRSHETRHPAGPRSGEHGGPRQQPTKLIEVVEIGKQLLITRGALTTFSIAKRRCQYFAIIPAAFARTYPVLDVLKLDALGRPPERHPVRGDLQRAHHHRLIRWHFAGSPISVAPGADRTPRQSAAGIRAVMMSAIEDHRGQDGAPGVAKRIEFNTSTYR